MANKKKNNKKKNSNNNQNKNYANKKETNEKIVKKEEETKIEEKIKTEEKINEEKIEAPEEVKVEIKEDVKETEEAKENKNDKKTSKEFNRRFWIDVILLLLIFVVIGILFCQIMSNSLETDTTVSPIVVPYEIKNSALNMSIEEYIASIQSPSHKYSMFDNLENKDINEEGKGEEIFYYQGLLGEDNIVGITTKEENEEIISIDFISRKGNENYKEDFKRVIEKTLYSSGLEEKDVNIVINKFKNREKLDKTYNNVRVFMDYSSKDFYVTKIIYNKRLSTSLKSIYSQEVSDLIGEVD